MTRNSYLKVILDLKPGKVRRNFVHKNGLWHYCVLTNLIKIDSKGKLKILVQKRSDHVDIAVGKYDQSVATQMLYSEKNNLSTLFRGLKIELGLKKSEIQHKEFLPFSNFFISKEYSEHTGILNREKISLFIVKLKKDRKISINCPKVASIRWMFWDEFVRDVRKNPNNYTKTVRFFIMNNFLRKKLEEFMFNFVNNMNNNSVNKLRLNYLYSSPKSNSDSIFKL